SSNRKETAVIAIFSVQKVIFRLHRQQHIFFLHEQTTDLFNFIGREKIVQNFQKRLLFFAQFPPLSILLLIQGSCRYACPSISTALWLSGLISKAAVYSTIA